MNYYGDCLSIMMVQDVMYYSVAGPKFIEDSSVTGVLSGHLGVDKLFCKLK